MIAHASDCAVHNEPAYPAGPCDCGATPDPRDVEVLARQFHNIYESVAPLFNYHTKLESRVPWEDVPEPNKTVMIQTCKQLLANKIVTLRDDLRAK